jgi:putative Mn2+ efflux pump MntP
VILVGSILAECFADNWKTWIAAKLLAGAGVGMLQVRGLAAVKLL